jgi:hypothetical protein
VKGAQSQLIVPIPRREQRFGTHTIGWSRKNAECGRLAATASAKTTSHHEPKAAFSSSSYVLKAVTLPLRQEIVRPHRTTSERRLARSSSSNVSRAGACGEPWVVPHNRRPQAGSYGKWEERNACVVGVSGWSMAMTQHAVVVAGGGPTGLMLAGELALARVDVAIVERRESHELAGSRAGGLHSRTIEVLDQRGIADRFLSQGQVAQVASFARIPLDISDFPTRHNYGLALWQNRIERILADWVGELAVPIYRGLEVTGLRRTIPASTSSFPTVDHCE